jgi:hypothetical protein
MIDHHYGLKTIIYEYERLLKSFFPPQADGVFLVSSLRAVSPTGWKQETKKKIFLKILRASA